MQIRCSAQSAYCRKSVFSNGHCWKPTYLEVPSPRNHLNPNATKEANVLLKSLPVRRVGEIMSANLDAKVTLHLKQLA